MNRLVVDSSALILMAGRRRDRGTRQQQSGYVKLLRAQYVNVRDLLNYDYLVIPQNALARDRRDPGLGRRVRCTFTIF